MAKTTYSREELERQLAESRREFWAADATINNLELMLADMAAHLENTEDKLGMVDHFGDATKKAMLHGSEPVTDTTNQQFESLRRGDK